MERSAPQSDKDLLTGLAQHDQQSLDQLYSSWFPLIRGMVRKFQGTEEDAKDVFQDGIMVLYEKSRDPGFQLDSRLSTFLYAVCYRIWLKKWQSNQRNSPFPADADEHAAQEEDLVQYLEKEQQFRLMASCLKQLGEPCRTLLEDFYIRKYSMLDISEKFGYTNADNAKTQKYKCLSRLKKLFFEQYNRRGTIE